MIVTFIDDDRAKLRKIGDFRSKVGAKRSRPIEGLLHKSDRLIKLLDLGVYRNLLQQRPEFGDGPVLFIAVQGDKIAGRNEAVEQSSNSPQPLEIGFDLSADFYLEAPQTVSDNVFFEGIGKTVLRACIGGKVARFQGIEETDRVADNQS